MGLPTTDSPCFLCGEAPADPLWTTPDRAFAVPGLYTVARCRRCGFLYQKPRVSDAHLADCYPDHYPRHQEPSRHLSHFSPEPLERAVEQAGGRVEWCWHGAEPRYYLWSLGFWLRDRGWSALARLPEWHPVYGVLKLLLEVTLRLVRLAQRGEVIRVGVRIE